MTAVIITLLSVVSGQNDGAGLSPSDGAGVSPSEGAGISPSEGAGISPSVGEGFSAASNKCEYFEIIIFLATIVYLS